MALGLRSTDFARPSFQQTRRVKGCLELLSVGANRAMRPSRSHWFVFLAYRRLHGSYPESALCKVKDGVLDVWSATWKVSSGCRLCSQASGRLRLPIASIIARRILRLRPSSGLQIVNPATRGLDRSAWRARRARNTLPGKRWSSPRMRTRRPSDRADSPCTRGFQAIALMLVTLRRPATRRLRSMPGHATLPAAIDWMRPHQAPCAAPTRGYSATPHTTSRHTVR